MDPKNKVVAAFAASLATLVLSCAHPGPKEESGPLAALNRMDAEPTLADRIRWPQAITTGTSDDYSPSATPDGKAVVYVSTRRGNPDLFIRYLPGSGSVGDYPLTFHTARDFSPAVSPTGEQVAFISTRNDPRGDLYISNLRLAEKIPELIRQRLYQQSGSLLSKPEAEVEAQGGTGARVTKYLLSQGELVRVTKGDESEAEPVWGLKGDQLYFCRVKNGKSEIVRLAIPGEAIEKIAQGSMPAPSPDGTKLAYVNSGSLFLLNVESKHTQQITSGPLDASPTWNKKGDRIFFSRFADDTNGDGHVTLADNAAIFSIAPNASEPDSKLHRLTAGNRSDLFPTYSLGRVLFSSTRTSGAGLSHLMSFDEGGWFSESFTAENLFALSSDLETSDPRTAALALSEVAFRWVEKKPEANFRRARILEQVGDRAQAYALWSAGKKGGRERWALRSALEETRLDLDVRLSAPLSAAEKRAAVQRAVSAWKTTAQVTSDKDVKAYALLYEGRAWLKIWEEANAVRAFDAVVREYPKEVDAAAPGMLEKAALYKKFGETDKLIRGYVEVLRLYPDASPWSTQAADEATNAALVGIKNPGDREARLRELAASESNTRVLPAHALNRLGESQLERNKPTEAETTLRSVLSQYPKERREVARAKLTLSRILTERGDYEEALALYREAEMEVSRSDPWRVEAKRRYVGNLLAKGRSALAGKDVRLAIRTFRDLIAFDYTLPQAHRGLVASYAAIGETQEAIEIYRDEVKKYPDYYLPRYALGLAYTYLEPPSTAFDRAQPELEQAISMNGQAVFPHQTLGFVLEKREELLKQPDQLERALDEYSISRTLNDPKEDFQNYADLTLNLGNGYFLLKDYSKAFDFYLERERLEAPFEPNAQKLVFLERFARSAFHMNEYMRAESLLTAARELLKRMERDGELEGRELLSHRAEQTDLRALTLGQAGKHAEAAKAFGETAELNRAMNEPANTSKALRNMAIHLFDSPSANEVDRERALSDARDTFGESLDILGRSGAKTTTSKKTGSLVNMDMEVALGEDTSEAARGFNTKAEKDLIYTFLGRIDRERGDDAAALHALDVKTSLLPSEQSMDETKRPAFLLKRSILANQRGVLLFRMGQLELSAQAFRSSIQDARTIGHEMGVALGALSLARLHVGASGIVSTQEAASFLDEAWVLLQKRTDAEAAELSARIALEHLAIHDWTGEIPSDVSDAFQPKTPLTKILAHIRESRRDLSALPKRTAEQEGLILSLDLVHFEASGHRAVRIRGGDSLAAIEKEAKNLKRTDLELKAKIVGARLGAVSLEETLTWISGQPVRGLESSLVDLLPLLQNQLREALQKGAAENAYKALEWKDRILLALALSHIPLPAGEDRGIDSLSRADIIDAAELQELLGPNRLYVQNIRLENLELRLVIRNDGIELLEKGKPLPKKPDVYVTHSSLCTQNAACGIVRNAAHLFYALSAQSLFDRRWLATKAPAKSHNEWLTWNGRTEFETKVKLADVFIAPPETISSPLDSPLRSLLVSDSKVGSTFEQTLPVRLLLGSGVSTVLLTSSMNDLPMLAEAWARGGVATTVVLPEKIDLSSVSERKRAIRIGTWANGSSAQIYGALGWNSEDRKQIATERLQEIVGRAATLYRSEKWGESVRAFEQALEILDSQESDESREQILDAASTAAWKADDVGRAIPLAEQLVAFRRKNGLPGLANALEFLGVLLSRAERYTESVKALEEASALYQKEGASEKVASSLATRGIVFENANRYKDALASFDQSLSIYSKAGGRGIGEQWRRIGRIYYLRLNQYSRAAQAFKKAADHFAKAKDFSSRDESRLEMALVDERRASFERARRVDQDVFAEAEKRKDFVVAAKAALYSANTYWYEGSYFEAFQWQRKAMDLAEKANDDRLRMLAHSTLGLIQWTLNRYDVAISEQEKALSLADKLVSPIDQASAHNNIGLVMRERGDLEASIASFDRAIVIDKKLGTTWGLSYDFRNKGISETKLGRLAPAEKNLSEAVSLSHSIGAKENEAKSRLSLADLYAVKKQWSEAILNYQEALRLAREGHVREVEWRALHGLGRTALARKEVEEALIQLRQAVDVVEKLSASIKIEEFRNGFMTNKSALYEDTILALLQKGKGSWSEAWSFAERARSRSFIDLLGNRGVGASAPTDRKLLARDSESRRKIEELEDHLAEASNAAERTDRLATLRAARKEREELLIDLRAANPQLSAFVTVEAVSLPEVQKWIGRDTALIEYFLGDREIIAWVITSEGITVTRTPALKKDVEAKIVTYSKWIQEQKPLLKLSEELYSWLIRPLEKDLGRKTFVGISPHGSLHYVAFASLFDGTKYLIDRYPIFYTPSASVLKYTLQPRPIDKANARVLAVGNPDLGNQALDLPFAEKEVGAIARQFPRIDVLTRKDATEKWVVANIGKYEVLHFASHGEFDSINPLFSAIRLSPSKGDNGELRVEDIFNLKLQADLVTLSACQTGLAKIEGGDELVGLNRSFLYAGTHSILSSLWRISDVATAVLIKRFYRNYVTSSKAESLRSAQLLVRNYYPHPSYWAALALTGDYR